jgi:AAA family ATP:ADP antiporter
MLLVAAAILALSLVVFNVIDARERLVGRGRSGTRSPEAPIGDGNAFGLVMRNRYLLLIAALILLLNWVNATGEYILSSIVQRAGGTVMAASPRAQQGSLSVTTDYFQVVNIAGMRCCFRRFRCEVPVQAGASADRRT